MLYIFIYFSLFQSAYNQQRMALHMLLFLITKSRTDNRFVIHISQYSANIQGAIPSLLPQPQSTSIQKDTDCWIVVMPLCHYEPIYQTDSKIN